MSIQTDELRKNCEQWASITGYNNYEVSWFGRVRNSKTGRILKPILCNRGYYSVNLYESGRMQPHNIHVLVAREWISNPDSKRNVDHIDGCKTNNHHENLRFATHSENAMNVKKKGSNTTSMYKGVSFHKPLNKWLVHVSIGKKCTHVGYFETEREAAEAYNAAATEHYGIYKKLNEFTD